MGIRFRTVTGELCGRRRLIVVMAFDGLVAEANEPFVFVEVSVHSFVALLKRDPESVSDVAVDIQWLGIIAECRLADDRIGVVGFLEQSPTDLLWIDRGDNFELTLVFE
jgi:hypothetical protein